MKKAAGPRERENLIQVRFESDLPVRYLTPRPSYALRRITLNNYYNNNNTYNYENRDALRDVRTFGNFVFTCPGGRAQTFTQRLREWSIRIVSILVPTPDRPIRSFITSAVPMLPSPMVHLRVRLLIPDRSASRRAGIDVCGADKCVRTDSRAENGAAGDFGG